MRIDDLEKERQWIMQAKQGNEEAMQALIGLHLPLIRMLASRIHVSYMDTEIFVQAGSIGLIEAVKRYVCCREAKLITYAVPWILGEMKKAVRRETAPPWAEDFGVIGFLCRRGYPLPWVPGTSWR